MPARIQTGLASFSFLALAFLPLLGCAPKSNSAPDALATESIEVPKLDDDAPPNQLSNAEIADGWILLFDGESLFGWNNECKADFRVQDGVIAVSAGAEPLNVDDSNEQVGLLRTTTQFDDYLLKVDFRCPRETNSGIFLRTSPRPQKPGGDCYELNIAGAGNPFPTSSLVGQQRVNLKFDNDGWQRFEVRVEGREIQVKTNGVETLKFTDPQALGRGYIGLQHNAGEIEFRNIKLKPLGLSSLFNGKDLSGWRQHQDLPDGKFEVSEDGDLRVLGGRGQLETDDSYGDFYLQLQCRTHAPSLNSGVFFRCIPRDIMMGYESQIQNGYLEGDRTQPEDCGTGGIFRRVDARRVVADDQQWFTKTIVAEGPHFSVWVNGFQVTDWIDRRRPNENPRRGLRREAGTIMLQGHDETTDISFRNLNVREMRPRRP